MPRKDDCLGYCYNDCFCRHLNISCIYESWFSTKSSKQVRLPLLCVKFTFTVHGVLFSKWNCTKFWYHFGTQDWSIITLEVLWREWVVKPNQIRTWTMWKCHHCLTINMFIYIAMLAMRMIRLTIALWSLLTALVACVRTIFWVQIDNTRCDTDKLGNSISWGPPNRNGYMETYQLLPIKTLFAETFL